MKNLQDELVQQVNNLQNILNIKQQEINEVKKTLEKELNNKKTQFSESETNINEEILKLTKKLSNLEEHNLTLSSRDFEKDEIISQFENEKEMLEKSLSKKTKELDWFRCKVFFLLY